MTSSVPPELPRTRRKRRAQRKRRTAMAVAVPAVLAALSISTIAIDYFSSNSLPYDPHRLYRRHPPLPPPSATVRVTWQGDARWLKSPERLELREQLIVAPRDITAHGRFLCQHASCGLPGMVLCGEQRVRCVRRLLREHGWKLADDRSTSDRLVFLRKDSVALEQPSGVEPTQATTIVAPDFYTRWVAPDGGRLMLQGSSDSRLVIHNAPRRAIASTYPEASDVAEHAEGGGSDYTLPLPPEYGEYEIAVRAGLLRTRVAGWISSAILPAIGVVVVGIIIAIISDRLNQRRKPKPTTGSAARPAES